MLPHCSKWRLYLQYFLICSLYSLSLAVSIDNDIIGDPDIECMDDRIRVWIKTRKPFAGRIYAKGRAETEECYKDDFARSRTRKLMFDLSFGACGMRSLRSVDPRGMYYGITVVISFHPLFITKVDQAFHVKCFFEEANRGLTAELGVSMIPTTEVEARHGIPGCSYSIHRSSIADLDAGRPAGQAIQFARVGDKVLHQWHCNDQMFGILINSCYVTDGFGKKAEVIDANGCPTNPILITGIRYSSDMQRAYAESQVFKFADKPGVWFFCQIQMCMKKAGMCQGVTPPSCSSTAPATEGDGEFNEKTLGGELSVDDSEEFTAEAHPRGRVGNRGGSGGAGGGYQERPSRPGYGNKKGGHGPPDYGAGGDYGVEGDADTAGGADYPEYGTPKKTKSGGLKKKKNRLTTPSTDYEESNDYDANLKLHSPDSGSYALPPTTPLDSGNLETTTLFGPPIPPALPTDTKATTIGTVSVSEDFETEDDLTSNEVKASTKKDYNDYDEVTIPPNLTDLLANLPDDISADSLQRMFRDSVVDRKALLESFDMLKKEMMKENAHLLNPHSKRIGRSGDKIERIQIDWSGARARARDSPIPAGVPPMRKPATPVKPSSEEQANILENTSTVKVRRDIADAPNAQSPPMIAGQLMIFEIDEEPPMEGVNAGTSRSGASSLNTECAISRGGLLAVAGGLGTVSAALFLVAMYFFVRLNHLNSAKLKGQSTSREHLHKQEVYMKDKPSGLPSRECANPHELYARHEALRKTMRN